MSIFDHFGTDGKPWVSAFHRLKNHRKRTSPSKVMAILSLGLWFWKFHENHKNLRNHMDFHGFWWFSWNFQNQIPKLKIAITFDGDVYFWWFWYRLKAASQGFPSVEESSKMDITIKSYGDFEFGLGFSKIHKK